MIELKRQKEKKGSPKKTLTDRSNSITRADQWPKRSPCFAWLSQLDVPARFDADKALFGYFAGQKHKPVRKVNVLRFAAWSSAAAAVLALLLVTGNAINKDTDNYVFIQGKKYTNLTLAKKEAQSTLSLLFDEQDEVSKSSSLLNDGDKVIQEHLTCSVILNCK